MNIHINSTNIYVSFFVRITLVIFKASADVLQVVDVDIRNPEVPRELGVQREVDLVRIPAARIEADRVPVPVEKAGLEPLDDEVEREADGELDVVDFDDLEDSISLNFIGTIPGNSTIFRLPFDGMVFLNPILSLLSLFRPRQPS